MRSEKCWSSSFGGQGAGGAGGAGLRREHARGHHAAAGGTPCRRPWALTSGSAFPRTTPASPVLTLFISGGVATTGTVYAQGQRRHPVHASRRVTSPACPSRPATRSRLDRRHRGQGHPRHGSRRPISVYGLNDIASTTDAYLALPTASEGTRYRVARLLGWQRRWPHGGRHGERHHHHDHAQPDGRAFTPPASRSPSTSTRARPTSCRPRAVTCPARSSPPTCRSASTATTPAPTIPAGFSYCDTVVEQMPPTIVVGHRVRVRASGHASPGRHLPGAGRPGRHRVKVDGVPRPRSAPASSTRRSCPPA